jgi:HK97 family phage prohead protease
MTTMHRFLAAAEVLGDRQVAVIAATGGVKRDQNDIDPNGISTANYLRNPIWLWMHSPDSPVGVCTHLAIVNGELRAICMFAPEGVSALADQCYSLVRAGVINACSIGFEPKASTPIDPKRPRGGQLITRCELLEISWVAVGADPNALVVQRAVQGDAARFASLQRVPEASQQRAFAQIPKRSDGAIFSHAGHVFALLRAREIDEAASRAALPARKAEVERLRQLGRRHHH